MRVLVIAIGVPNLITAGVGPAIAGDGGSKIYGSNIESCFQDIFGVPALGIANGLLNAKLRVGFEAQEFGRRQPSVASSGIIVYSLLTLPSLSIEAGRALVREIGEWIDVDGKLSPEVPPRSESIWANAQCLLALCQRPDLLQATLPVRRLAQRLGRQRKPTGSWPLRPGLPSSGQVLYSVYPILSLLAVDRVGLADERIRNILRAEAGRLQAVAASIDCLPLDRLACLALIKLLTFGGLSSGYHVQHDDSLTVLEEQLWRDGRLYLEDVTITDENQPIWYARIFRPALYMFARQLWPVGHPIPTLLAEELRQRFNPARSGWGHQNQKPLTWATALGLRTGLALAADLLHSPIELYEWEMRVRQLLPPVLPAYDYDVVISFSGQQRAAAEEINSVLKSAGLVTFYDYDREHELLGEDLTIALQRIYFSRSRYAVAILSRDFVDSKWAGNWEWRAILAAMQQRNVSYVLPYFYDEVSVPGLSPTIGYISRWHATPGEFARIVIRKLRRTV